MLSSTLLFVTLALSSVFAQPTNPSNVDHAASVHARANPNRHHHRSHAHAVRDNKLQKRTSTKKQRCVAKASNSTTTATAAATTTTTTTSAASSATNGTSSSSGSGGGGSSGGVISITDSKCGATGATAKTTETTGPNGSLQFMDCGISKSSPNSGWTPPFARLSDLIFVDMDTAMADSNSPFKTCQPFIETFKSVAAATTISDGTSLPPIMLASFAMQESSCQQHPYSPSGGIGLFQLSSDKCTGSGSGSACYDVEYNTQTAANYIRDMINDAGGNVFQMVGVYNGWNPGMTYKQATAAADGSCCTCQNNLDYLHQFFNGWMQNIDAYSANLGLYFNLNVC